jgi:hypothetical protein
MCRSCQKSFLCMEYLTVQEYTHDGYNMVDSTLLHILIKKICRFLFIVRMSMQKNKIQLLAMNNNMK